jgi:alkylhydroperoxidase family enzyme
MARVSYVATAEAEGDAREVFTKMEERGQNIINLHRALGNVPGSLRSFLRLGNSLLFRGKLPHGLRELAIMRLAQTRGADYEWAHHAPLALQAGLSQQQIDELKGWQESQAYDERERAVLGYVDAVLAGEGVPDAVFEAVRSHLSESETVELTLVCGYWGMVASMLVALAVDVEPDYLKFVP